ncbi:hypothetical protein SDC9_163848 [bioreactor metagenome]|uniref:Uncharacterized protein n=1 Tax=bioreactor metagenome TaxID=1076179 RepID=A0A645FX66_9ZZZZ
MRKRLRVFGLFRLNAGHLVKRAFLLSGVPGRLIKAVVSGVGFCLQPLADAEIVVSFAVVWVRVRAGQLCNRRLKIPFRFLQTAAPEKQKAVCVVDARVGRIALKPFEIVVLRQVSRVAVLLKVRTIEEEILVGCRFLRRRNGFGRFGQRLRFRRFRAVGDDARSVGIQYGQFQRAFERGDSVGTTGKRLFRRNIRPRGKHAPAAFRQHDFRVGNRLCRIYAKTCRTFA